MLSNEAVERLRNAARDRAPVEPGSAEERYRLEGEIGRGGMGIVYRAYDTLLEREVAVKVPSQAAGADLERRLQLEAHVIARLEHPGIVPIHDTGRFADGRLFYVMKQIRGHTLPDYLASAPAQAERLRVFERICETISFAHANGVIHRDLKPENIMVGAFGEVMVMDWGAAKVLDRGEDATSHGPDTAAPSRHTRPGTAVGTRGFMAPEQAGHAPAVDARADVYGLGAILLFMLTGHAPPAEGAAAAALTAPGLDRPLRAVCARALAADPGDRYAGASAVAEDLARYRSGLPVEAHRETLLDRSRRLGRTYRTAILLVLAYIVMRAVVALTAGW
jgi:serine/threonine protein kinase